MEVLFTFCGAIYAAKLGVRFWIGCRLVRIVPEVLIAGELNEIHVADKPSLVAYWEA
jgi:hypothetical protein